MAGSIATCVAYKLDIMNGVHQPGDQYKIALYTSVVGLDENTAVYSPANEVAETPQTKYLAGGQSLTGRTATVDQGRAVMSFDDPVWASSSIAARGALLYNASKGGRAVAVIDFGEVVESRNGPFRVRMPPATGATGLVIIA